MSVPQSTDTTGPGRADAQEQFDRTLVAVYSPANRCFTPEGQELVLLARESVPQRAHVRHWFVSASDRTTRSQFAWVSMAPSYALDEYLRRHFRDQVVGDATRAHLVAALRAARGRPVGTVLAAEYTERGVINRHMEIFVHPVKLYPTAGASRAASPGG